MTPAHRRLLLVALSFAAFVSLGLPDAVLGVAWPSVRRAFGLPISRLGAFLACGVAGYLVSSFLAGNLVRRFGVGRVLLFSTVLAAAGLTGYALVPRWELLLPAAACVGLGSGAIDAGINAFAASAFSARVVTWLHAFYGVGATLGPVVMTAAVTADDAAGWRWGYGWIAAALAAMAIGFAATLPLWRVPGAEPGGTGESPATAGEALRNPVVLAQVLFFLLYTGTEVTAAQWLFSLLSESRGLAAATAGAAVAAFWAALTVGRIVSGQVAATVPPVAILRFALLVAPVGAMLLCVRASAPSAAGQAFAFAGAALLGFALAPVFPMLISATPARVGPRLAAQAIGFQVSAATLGVAALPSLAGLLARRVGLEVIGPFLLAATVALFVLHEVTVRIAGRGRVVTGARPDRPFPTDGVNGHRQ